MRTERAKPKGEEEKLLEAWLVSEGVAPLWEGEDEGGEEEGEEEGIGEGAEGGGAEKGAMGMGSRGAEGGQVPMIAALFVHVKGHLSEHSHSKGVCPDTLQDQVVKSSGTT